MQVINWVRARKEDISEIAKNCLFVLFMGILGIVSLGIFGGLPIAQLIDPNMGTKGLLIMAGVGLYWDVVLWLVIFFEQSPFVNNRPRITIGLIMGLIGIAAWIICARLLTEQAGPVVYGR